MKGPLLLAAGLALVLASTGEGAKSPSLVIRVRSLQGVYRSHDAVPKGPSKGDVLEIRDKLFNLVPQFGQPAGALVGSDQAKVVYLSKQKARVAAVVSLPDGTLKLRGTWLVDRRGSTLQVVGGTGRYAHAAGTETTPGGSSSALNAPNVYRVQLR